MKGKISVPKLSITLDNRHTQISLTSQISDLIGCCLLGVGCMKISGEMIDSSYRLSDFTRYSNGLRFKPYQNDP